jgi:antitoxin ChpS
MQRAGKIDKKTARAAGLFAERVRQGEPTARLVLFGSRARGDHGPESDLDVAVVTDRMVGGRAAMAGALADLAFDILLETGVLVAPLPITQAEWNDPARFSNPRLIEAILTEGRAV